MVNDTTGPEPAAKRFQITLPWGMRVSLYVDDGRPWLDLIADDDGSGASTALTPDALRLIVHHAALMVGGTVVELPEPNGRSWAGASMWDAEARYIEARVDQRRRPFVRCDGKPWSIPEAEAVGLALVAAAREARRLASESSEDYYSGASTCTNCGRNTALMARSDDGPLVMFDFERDGFTPSATRHVCGEADRMTNTNSARAAATCICPPNGNCIDGAATGPSGEVCDACASRAIGTPCFNGANDDPDGEVVGSVSTAMTSNPDYDYTARRADGSISVPVHAMAPQPPQGDVVDSMTNASARDLVEKYRRLTDQAWVAYVNFREDEHRDLMNQGFATLDLMPANIRQAAQRAHDLGFVAREDKLRGMDRATIEMREARAQAATAIVEDLLKTCGVER